MAAHEHTLHRMQNCCKTWSFQSPPSRQATIRGSAKTDNALKENTTKFLKTPRLNDLSHGVRQHATRRLTTCVRSASRTTAILNRSAGLTCDSRVWPFQKGKRAPRLPAARANRHAHSLTSEKRKLKTARTCLCENHFLPVVFWLQSSLLRHG